MANLGLDKYSTEEGVRDVLGYHAAGSLVSALVLVAAESGEAKQAAEEELKITEDKLAGIRNTTFTDDKASQMLEKLLMPDGVNIDSQNQAQIRDWLDGNGLKSTPIQVLINGAEFAAKRKQAVQDLNLTDK